MGGPTTHDLLLQQHHYQLGKTLGTGTFGKVKLAKNILTGREFAIKILDRKTIKEKKMEEKVNKEIQVLSRLMHPHIMRLYDVIETKDDICLVTEYLKSGELFQYILESGRVQESKARMFFQQIISGVEYCHINMVVHRDLKPENLILESEFNVKIADFGLSNIMRDGHFLKTSCGSPNYAAPEVIFGRLYAGPEVDVWSCGVILYVLLCGKYPFEDDNLSELFRKIKGGIYRLPTHLSLGARELIGKMLEVDPMKRITIPEIRQHPWFQLELPLYLAVPPPDTMQQAIPGYMDPRAELRPQLPVERKWALGVQSPAHPHVIMIGALKALQQLNVCWKKIGRYNMKCRWDAGFPNHHEGTSNSNEVKFELQLYKTREDNYILDLQRVHGPEFLFLDLCAAFLSQLHVA